MSTLQPACRSCEHDALKQVLSLGTTPLADRLLTENMLAQDEPKFPLTVYFCPKCGLVQIAETVPPEQLFCEDYPYYSSFSPALLEHSRLNAEELIASRGLGQDSLVVELASNDGYMLKNFHERSIPVLGIDPAEGPAGVAREAGIETMCTFFTRDLARELRDQGRQADVIIANNVLAHVADTNGFVAGIATLIKESGTTSIEVPYVKDLIEHCEFDTIYHEHLCYFSLTALVNLFARHGLTINEIKRVSIHGGSLRVFASPRPEVGDSVKSLLEEERQAGVDQFGYYQDFADRVVGVRDALREMLLTLKREGKRIAAYGAAAKGATMINYVGIGPDIVDFVVDRNTHKHDKYMPGQHLPIHPCEKLVEAMPDHVLVLAWNFADEIIKQQAEYLRRGGAFIIPIPSPRIIRSEEPVASH